MFKLKLEYGQKSYKFHHLCAMLVLPFLIVPGESNAEGEWSTSGFIRAQSAISTEDGNPNNAALGLETDNDLNLAKGFGVLDMKYVNRFDGSSAIDKFSFFARARVNWDMTQSIDNGLSPYDAFPAKNRSSLLRVQGDEAAAEIWEIFADITAGNSWFRFGRQNIVWGEADAIRLLDVVNALDQTQHLFIEAGEQFDHIRIPVWAARGTYRFKSAPHYSLDAYVIPGDFVPTWLPDRGAPFNLRPFPENVPPTFLEVPPFFIPGLRVEDNVSDRRGDVEGGIRLLGKIGGTQYTLNYISKIDQDGVLLFDRFDPAGGQVVLKNWHNRVDIFGFSTNSFIEPLGAVLRSELIFTPDQPYADLLTGGTQIIEADTTKFVVGIDRPTFLLNKNRAMSISVQWIQTYRDVSKNEISINGAPADKSETSFSLFLSQPYNNDQIVLEFLGVYDTDGAYWLQPAIKYNPGNHWRTSLYGNFFGGSEDRPGRFGSLDWASEINVQVTYQF